MKNGDVVEIMNIGNKHADYEDFRHHYSGLEIQGKLGVILSTGDRHCDIEITSTKQRFSVLKSMLREDVKTNYEEFGEDE